MSRVILGQKINVQFFLAANAALILITLGTLLIPCSVSLVSSDSSSITDGLLSIISVSGFAILGLLYCVKKGKLGWLSPERVVGSTQSSPPESKKKEGI